MARRRGALRRTRLRGASLVLGLAGPFAVLGLAGCADVGSTPGDVGADPCSEGAPGSETPSDPGFTGEPPADAMEWQESAEDLAGRLTALAGDRLGGVWLDWAPERTLVITLTRGPEVPEVRAEAAASGLAVDVRYTATVSQGDLLAAADRVSGELGQVPGVAGMGVDEMNSRLVFDVASGDDGGAATCARLIEVLADAGVPYGFDVFEGPVESTVRTTVSFSEAYASAGATVDLIVGSCNGDPEVTALEQTADEVRVEVTSTVPAPGWAGDGCLDSLTVALDAPLGDRVLVDMTSGDVVEVPPVGP